MRTDRTRVTFRPGQCLAGADLAARSTVDDELLALHHARVHGAWGIATGFECSLEGDELVLAPGMGLDAVGRMILLSQARRLPVPAAGNVMLVAAYAAHPGANGCAPDALPVEAPVLRWRRRAEPSRVGLELPIVLLRRSGETEIFDLSVRKVAHALVRPKVATGRVQRSSTPVQGTYGNWTMTVPTASGGLSTPSPAYFVSLDQHPWGELANFGTDDPPPANQRLAEWVGPFVALERVTSTDFTVRVSGRLGNWREGDYPEPGTNPVGLSWIAIDTTFQPFDFRWLVGGRLRPNLLFFGGVP